MAFFIPVVNKYLRSMNYIQVAIETNEAEQHEILVALLADIGFEGFEESDNGIKAFIKESMLDTEALNEVVNNLQLQYSLTTVAQQNWNAQWERSFEPVMVENFVAVRADFHTPVTNVQHEIIITPKMSFGTGHHATTYLMMQQMSHINFVDKTVFDFGTGTGVLAILAEKMGALKIDAVDIDEWSIENTNENIAANKCQKITVAMASAITTATKYDVVLANINLNVLLDNMSDIALICKKGATVLFSGILSSDENSLKESALKHSLIFKTVSEKSNWLCIEASC